MKTIVVTGSAGLIGSECVRYFCEREFRVVGIDNDMRAKFFGKEASTVELTESLRYEYPSFLPFHIDIRSQTDIDVIFVGLGLAAPEIVAVIHTAAQPSHDWAASDPQNDFAINAVGTLTLLEATRRYCPKAAFIFTSTNKVYGDLPNFFRIFDDEDTRYEPSWTDNESLEIGIDESMSIDQSKHSLFGCSKLAADVLVQEYGRYFGMNTVSFRCGCITGPAHQGAKLHGFLSYLVRCAMTGEPYTVIGYNGKQVRDNLHAADLVTAFDEYLKAPRPGEVYNMGGGRENSCSVREAIRLVEEISGKSIEVRYEDEPRSGDHKWWITDTRKFRGHYPKWNVRVDLREIIRQIIEAHSGACGREELLTPTGRRDYSP